MKQWKRLAALSSAIVMAMATLTYFPNDTLQNIRWEISASADETSAATWTKTESDGLTWTLDADGTLTISGTGAMKDYDYDSNPSPVYHNSKVKKIVIENGVTSIGEWAFYSSGLNSVTIPDSVTSIGSHAFYDCSSLTNITIPDSVTSIGYAAFSGCRSLTNITIPNSVTSIGNDMFSYCSSLTSITIPDSVTSIGMCAFSECSSLTSITIPKSVTSIGSGVFDNCNNLTVYLENGSTLTSNDLGVDESKIVSYSQWNEDNLTWKLDADGTLTISGTGAMKNYDYSGDNQSPVYNNSSVKKVVIEYGVTSIGTAAFSYCISLTDITIPNSVTSIGYGAFVMCSSLASITIPNGVTSIGNSAFDLCTNLTSITIPDSVTSIGDYAFYNCTSLPSITLPDNVNSIGNSVFSYCRSLTSITIPDSVTSIGIEVFQKCTSLKTISLSCKSSLKRSDFGEQANLVSYTLHTLKKTEAKTVTCTEDGNIEYWTCEHCGKYFLSDDANPETAKAVEQSETIIPALKHKNATTRGAVKPTETEPGYSGDRYCPDCDTVFEKGYTYWNEGNLTWKLDADGTLTISGTGAMKNYDYDNPSPATQKKDSVKKVVIEDGVTSIGTAAFSGCGLISITIPNSVTSIENTAFSGCSSLTSITIPNSVTSIGIGAFSYCRSLTSITIPDSVTSIGNYVFSYTDLKSITIPDSVTSIGEWAFSDCSSLQTISLSCKSSLKRSDFGDQADLVSYTLHTLKKTEAKDATCTESGNKEYWTCEHCGKYFLSDDANPETAKAVEQSETVIPALKHKNATTRGAVKPTKTAPGYSGDRYCPDCDTVFEKGYTYWNEGNLTWKLYEDGTLNISGTGEMKNYNYFEGNQSPASQKKDSVKKVVIEDGVTSIGDAAFYGCSSLTSITIPNSVTSIGEAVFGNCGSLPSITIPDGVTSIGSSAFRDCTSLTSITIPNSITSIEEAAFGNCIRLTSITIPNSITSIGEAAFGNCVSLTSITIPESVTSIGNYAFAGCRSLTSITIPDSVTSIGNYTFNGCSGLTSITIPDSVTSIGYDVFKNCSNLTTISLSCKSSLKKSDFGGQANLVSYASHTLKKIEAKAATCTENGNIEHWTCEHCGKYFLSDDSNPETAKAVELSEITIPPIKHSYDKNGFCKNDDTHYQPASYNEKSEKYEISNAGQLYWFAEQVNSGNASLNAVLTTDIVVNETVLAADGSLGADPDTLRMWYPIGVRDGQGANIFKGTFDGQGHTISGLYFSNDSNESNAMCAGLFGVSAGIIQNIGLEDSYFNYYYAKMDGQLIVSGVAAGICEINDGQIVNCYNAGTILGYGASGICVLNSDNGSIENCYNTGVIRGSLLVAGICNLNLGSMKDCYNNSDITVRTDITIIDGNDEKNYASGICNNNISSGRIENCYHVGQVSGADVNNNICNHNEGQIENSYYDCNICDKDAITQNESSALVKNVEGKTTKQFASGEVTYLLNGDQSVRAFYQNLAKEKYPTLNQKSKVVMQLEMIYDESFGEDATTNKTYHNAGDTIALETSPDKAYTYRYFVNGKQIEEPYTLTGNTKMTVKRVPVEIKLSEIDTIQLTCQKKMTLDLTAYLKNFADLKPVQFQLATGSKLPDGLKLTEDGMLSGTPKKAATVKTTIVLTAENGATKEMHLVFIVNAPVTTTTTTITTTTTRATTTTKPSKTTTTKATTTTKPSKTTTTKATTTTKPSKTTTTKATTTTKPSKTTTTKATTTTKPSKTTTTKVTTTTKPNKTTTTKATTTTKPSKTTTTNATTTTKPSKTTTTNAITKTKPNKTTTTKATTTTIITTTNTAIPSYGDVNLDGKVDILDAVFLNKYLATLIQFSDAQMANADCCQDGILDDQDTTALMQFIILLIDDLPVQPTEK